MVDNFSLVHVMFDPPSVTFNKQDVFFYWYDMIGTFFWSKLKNVRPFNIPDLQACSVDFVVW